MTLRSMLSSLLPRRTTVATSSHTAAQAAVWTGRCEPKSAADVPNYREAFASCAALSQSLGAAPMQLTRNARETKRLSERVSAGLKREGVTEEHAAGMAGQCLKWSHFLAPAIERATGLRAWPTIGQLWHGDRRLFGRSWSELETLWERGAHPSDLATAGASGLDLHAWVTLSTGEIADLTFCATLARVFPETCGSYAGAIACGREDAIFPGHRYHPMLAGAHVFEALQARSRQLPFLARDIDDLARVAYALVLPDHS